MEVRLNNKTARVVITKPPDTKLELSIPNSQASIEVPRQELPKSLLAPSDIREELSTACAIVRDESGRITRIEHTDGVVDIVYAEGRISGMIKRGRTISIMRDPSGKIYGIGVN